MYAHKRQYDIAAIILSAGASRRMGRPKALLTLRNQTFVEKLVEDYLSLTCRPIIIVIGPRSDDIQTKRTASTVRIAVNRHPERGFLSSLQTGLRALEVPVQGFFFCPVDHPVVKRRTLNAMLEIWAGNPATAVRPRYQNRGGHPVLLGRNWIDKILALPLTSNMRALLHSHPQEVIEFPVTDPGILINIDTPEDYIRLLKEYP